MPTGQPDFRFSRQEQSEASPPLANEESVGGGVAEGDGGGSRRATDPDRVAFTVDRIIREAMGAGDFDDLPGTGKPIPGVGTVDDDMWWVRSWLKRNRHPNDQEPSSSS